MAMTAAIANDDTAVAVSLLDDFCEVVVEERIAVQRDPRRGLDAATKVDLHRAGVTFASSADPGFAKATRDNLWLAADCVERTEKGAEVLAQTLGIGQHPRAPLEFARRSRAADRAQHAALARVISLIITALEGDVP